MDIYDSHIHSINSFDGKQTVEEICRTALEKKLSGVTVSDHADLLALIPEKTMERMPRSIKTIDAAAHKYEGKLRVFRGVEMSEYHNDTENAKKILALTDYDVILGSVHYIGFNGSLTSYSHIDFGSQMPIDDVYDLLKEYLAQVSYVLDDPFFDVFCHLTCPLRYMNGEYGRGIDIMRFESDIVSILKKMIERRIALEVNTSGIGTPLNELMPDRRILKLYRELGGKLLTLGSDAHTSDRIGGAFYEAAEVLRKIGFGGYYYFDQRRAKLVPF